MVSMEMKSRQEYKPSAVDQLPFVMARLDLVPFLEFLGVIVHEDLGEEVLGYCPDHVQFTGHPPSHPKWYMNKISGLCQCYTEDRGSHLIDVVANMTGRNYQDSLQYIKDYTGGDYSEVSVTEMIEKRRAIRAAREDRSKKIDLDHIRRDIDIGHMTDLAYDYFMNPIGKAPTNITRDTVDQYKVFLRTYGRYTNRVVIPFYMEQQLVGFTAIDTLGRKEWLAENSMKKERDYRKSLYPYGFKRDRCLFGYDDLNEDCRYAILVEGAREVMKLSQEGYDNSLAVLGSGLTNGQLELLTKKDFDKVYLMFDGDEAGERSGTKVKKKLDLLYTDKTIVHLHLPEGADPKNLDAEGMKSILGF